MRIEGGKYYRTRDGRKVGPMERFGFSGNFRDTPGNGKYWSDSGVGVNVSDIVAEWSRGPVRTVTRKEIVPGVYGRVRVNDGGKAGMVGLWFDGHYFKPAELRAAAATFIELAAALDEVA